MKKTIALAVLAMAVLSVSLMAQDKDAAKKKDAVESKSAPAADVKQTPAPVGVATPSDYTIGPEDVLHIGVWKEPELSGQVAVRPDGKISIALLNDVQAAGLTPMQLRDQLRDKMKQYVTDPQVTVTVVAMNSRRIFIMGQVGRPGAFPMLPNMTLMQALSASGGFTPYANQKKMYLLRNENGKQTKMPINYKALISGNAPEQNIPLLPGDTIVVP